jgi:hypothetical protein
MAEARTSAYRRKVLLHLLIALVATALIGLAWKVLQVVFPRLHDLPVETILAFIAISFAIVQFLDARTEESELRKIEGSMSTRFIGLFPKNLAEITKVISKAEKHICIIVDYVGYGQYSDPTNFGKYFDALKAQAKVRDVKLLIYSDTLAKDESEKQFPDDENKFKEEAHTDHAKKYFEETGKCPTNFTELRSMLLLHNKKRLAELVETKAKAKELSDSPAFFLWLADDEEAVFAFKNIGSQRGYSFRTWDARLVKQFRNYFAELFDKT